MVDQDPSTVVVVFTTATPEVAHFGNESIDCYETLGKKFNESNVLDSNGQALPTPRVNPLFSSTINHEELFSEKSIEIDQDISHFDKNVAEIGEINIS
nr:hypothetical protein CFP56_43536 [Quercus suber]